MMNFRAPDLSQSPPRSPRVRLGGYVVLPRILDKARAQIAGTLGEYKWNNPLDQRLFSFAGIKAEDFLAAVKAGRSDTEMLAWFNAAQTPTRQAWEISAWSNWLETLPPGDVKRHRMFADQIEANCPEREDIGTLFSRLDLDDYLTFGGAA